MGVLFSAGGGGVGGVILFGISCFLLPIIT